MIFRTFPIPRSTAVVLGCAVLAAAVVAVWFFNSTRSVGTSASKSAVEESAFPERMVFDFPVSLAFPDNGGFSAVFTTRVENRRPEGGAHNSSDSKLRLFGVREKEMVLRDSGGALHGEIIRVFREFGEQLALRTTKERGVGDPSAVGRRSGRGPDITATSDPDAVFRTSPLETAGWTIRPGGGLGVQAEGVFVVGGMRFRLCRVGRAVNMDRYFSVWGRQYSKLVNPTRSGQVFYALPLSVSSDEAVFLYLHKGAVYQLRFAFPPAMPVAEALEKILPIAYGLEFSGGGRTVGTCVDDFGVSRASWDAASMGEKRRFLVRLSEFIRRTMRFDRSGPEGREGLGIHELRGGLPLFFDTAAGEIPKSFDRAKGSLDRTVDMLIRASGPRGEAFSPARFLDACVGVVYSPDRVHGDRYVFFMEDRVVFFVPPYAGKEPVLSGPEYADFGPDRAAPVGRDDDFMVFAGNRVLESRVLSEMLFRLLQGDEKTFAALYNCTATERGGVGRPVPEE